MLLIIEQAQVDGIVFLIFSKHSKNGSSISEKMGETISQRKEHVKNTAVDRDTFNCIGKLQHSIKFEAKFDARIIIIAEFRRRHDTFAFVKETSVNS